MCRHIYGERIYSVTRGQLAERTTPQHLATHQAVTVHRAAAWHGLQILDNTHGWPQLQRLVLYSLWLLAISSSSGAAARILTAPWSCLLVRHLL